MHRFSFRKELSPASSPLNKLGKIVFNLVLFIFFNFNYIIMVLAESTIPLMVLFIALKVSG
jgi:hypothetical protein